MNRKAHPSLLLATVALAVLATLPGSSRASTEGPSAADDPLFEAYASDLDAQGDAVSDPLEGLNRTTHAFNQFVEHWVLNPVISVYRFVVPDPGRRGVRNAISNLNSPAILVNDLLQLEVHDAGVTTCRFLINTTIGVAGLFDVSEEMGLPGHRSDFGQTLARYGVASGPYLVLPLLGPSTLRDGTGSLVDFMFRPTTYLLYGTDQVFFTSIQGGSAGLAEWDSQSDNLKSLEKTSVDYYAALRSAYYQHRTAEIQRADRRVEPPTAQIAGR